MSRKNKKERIYKVCQLCREMKATCEDWHHESGAGSILACAECRTHETDASISIPSENETPKESGAPIEVKVEARTAEADIARMIQIRMEIVDQALKLESRETRNLGPMMTLARELRLLGGA